MRHYKQVSGEDILAVGMGTGYTEITEAEYSEILAVIRNRPAAGGKGYRLKTDLTWEAYDLPPAPEPSDADELTDEEALNCILGVTA